MQGQEKQKIATADNNFCKDIEYLFQRLLEHPIFIREPQKLFHFKSLYERKCQNVNIKDKESLIDVATELTMFFEDGHTNIEIPYTSTDRLLLLYCDWEGSEQDKLILTEEIDGIPAGAYIISLENKSIDEIIPAMTLRIPHENRNLVKSRMLHYPYANYHVFSEINLRWLFGKKKKYLVTFQFNNKVVTKELPLVFYNAHPNFRENYSFYYEVENRSLVIHVDACLYNKEYLDFLDDCALFCKTNEIEKVVLDLSRNMGGSSAVIEPFIRHTNIDYYKLYEMLDYSSGSEETVCRRDEMKHNNKSENLFPQAILCKVSYNTFNNTRTFTITLQDNNIATIIGTHMGGNPNSFGLPKKDIMQNTGIRFRVSTCYFSRPNGELDEKLYLK